jgi:hypothetical protein
LAKLLCFQLFHAGSPVSAQGPDFATEVQQGPEQLRVGIPSQPPFLIEIQYRCFLLIVNMQRD